MKKANEKYFGQKLMELNNQHDTKREDITSRMVCKKNKTEIRAQVYARKWSPEKKSLDP